MHTSGHVERSVDSFSMCRPLEQLETWQLQFHFILVSFSINVTHQIPSYMKTGRRQGRKCKTTRRSQVSSLDLTQRMVKSDRYFQIWGQDLHVDHTCTSSSSSRIVSYCYGSSAGTLCISAGVCAQRGSQIQLSSSLPWQQCTK